MTDPVGSRRRRDPTTLGPSGPTGATAGSASVPPMRHVIWDWNGTLLDDLAIVVAAVNDSLQLFDADPIVRAHAVWAARRLGHPVPATDDDELVAAELRRPTVPGR